MKHRRRQFICSLAICCLLLLFAFPPVSALARAGSQNAPGAASSSSSATRSNTKSGKAKDNSGDRSSKQSRALASAAGTPSDADIAAAKAAGKVWVNLDSGIYHKGGRWYGKTKNGKFMTEAEAKAAGFKESRRN